MIILGCPKGHYMGPSWADLVALVSGTQYPRPERFCSDCGAKGVPLLTCICGRQFWPQDHFCGYCGAARPQEEKP